MSSLADLGVFKLGQVQLGASAGQVTIFDSIGFDDNILFEVQIAIIDSLGVADIGAIDAILEEIDSFGLSELLTYPALAQAGVQGRITLSLDITDVDMCSMVEEAGQSIELNDVPARAFLQIKQRSQTFDNEKKIYAGDAIMYSCPDLEIAVNDEVLHNSIKYFIATWIDRFFDGNLIFRKVALKRKADNVVVLPQVTGLSASDNFEGKTTLTWNDIDKDIYTSFNHFNVYRATVSGGPYTFIESTKNNKFTDVNLTPNTAYYYVVAAVDKYGYEYAASTEAVTGTDTSNPTTPTGGR